MYAASTDRCDVRDRLTSILPEIKTTANKRARRCGTSPQLLLKLWVAALLDVLMQMASNELVHRVTMGDQDDAIVRGVLNLCEQLLGSHCVLCCRFSADKKYPLIRHLVR